MGILKGGVAFFDSGVGGLTVLNECKKVIQDETFYYYGDNRRAPYGNRPQGQIEKWVFRVFKKFARLRVRAVVIACNTATAVCVEKLRKKYSFPIIGAEPAVYSACKKGGEIFVLSTRATFESERFQKLCARAESAYPNARIRSFACTALAGEIERHIFEKTYDYTPFFPIGQPNVVVLGCTHYVYIKAQVEKFYGCTVFDGNQGIANRLKSILLEKSRDEEPLLTRPVSAFAPLQKKRSEKPTENTAIVGNKRVVEDAPVYFLGGAKKVNKRTFEQMFAK